MGDDQGGRLRRGGCGPRWGVDELAAVLEGGAGAWRKEWGGRGGGGVAESWRG